MKADSVVVRHATPNDEDALVDLYMALHRDGIIHRDGISRLYPYNYGRILSGVQKATRRQGGICGVIDAPTQPGRLAGLVFMLLDQLWWTDYSFLILREWFVRPEYRKGTGYYKALREFAEEIRISCDKARPPGHPPILLEAAFINTNPEKELVMERLWRRFGKRVGGIYISGF